MTRPLRSAGMEERRHITTRILAMWDVSDRAMAALQPLASLLARLYVAQVFFASGLTKLRDWDITLALFADEYHVPLLSPTAAAYAGTGGELVLPVLLVLGLGGRLAALGLLIMNAVAVISLSEIAPQALQQHITWGVLLIVLCIFGVGKWSADFLLRHWIAHRAPK